MKSCDNCCREFDSYGWICPYCCYDSTPNGVNPEDGLTDEEIEEIIGDVE